VDGLVKDRTQCAPNGYYFIPVYDKVISKDTNAFDASSMCMCSFKCFSL
jgi:hypothetical protein